MKRCWFGGGLLLLLLLTGLWSSRSMDRFCLSLSRDMVRAAALTEEDRNAAQSLANAVHRQWESRRKLAAVLSDHAPMEQIEEDFRLLTPQAEDEDFRETCLRLSARLEALGTAQRLSLENLF